MVISGYFAYSWLLMVIGGYSIGGHWWLLMIIILMAIGSYYIVIF